MTDVVMFNDRPLRSWRGETMTPGDIRRLEMIALQYDCMRIVLSAEDSNDSGSAIAAAALERTVEAVERRVARKIAEQLRIPALAESYDAAIRSIGIVAENLMRAHLRLAGLDDRRWPSKENP